MAEYVLREEDDQAEVAKKLLEHAGPERAREIKWLPRPNRNQGGVFFVPDDLADGLDDSQLNRLDDGPSEEEQQRLAAEQAEDEPGQEPTPRRSRAEARRAAKANENQE